MRSSNNENQSVRYGNCLLYTSYYISPVISGRMCQITGDYISPNKPIPDNCPIIVLDQEQMDTILVALREK